MQDFAKEPTEELWPASCMELSRWLDAVAGPGILKATGRGFCYSSSLLLTNLMRQASHGALCKLCMYIACIAIYIYICIYLFVRVYRLVLNADRPADAGADL